MRSSSLSLEVCQGRLKYDPPLLTLLISIEQAENERWLDKALLDTDWRYQSSERGHV